VKGKRIAIILVVASACAIIISQRGAHTNAPPNVNSPTRSLKLQIPPQSFRAGRQVFPYSIIPGGVRSGKELEDSMVNDPVAAKHYAGINPQRLLVQRLKRDVDLFASYRVGNNVYWTTHALHVRAGELVLTDGVNLIRARCGNRLVRIPPLPEAPTSPVDPPWIVFEAGTPSLAPPLENPPLLAATLPGLSPAPAPVPPTPSSTPPIAGTYAGPIVLPPPSCFDTHESPEPPSPSPVTPVPEPSSFAMFITGLGAAGYAMGRLRRR